jgi:High potential iron-sulfur protein
MMKIRRRNLLKIGSLAVAALAIAARMGKPARAAAPHVDEKDVMAQSLGYKHDATKVDKAKFANYKAGETCATCQLYQGKPEGAWGPCPIFTGKEVSAKGWCSAYVKKA